MELKGWIELEGERLSENKVEATLAKNPSIISKFGGEFFIKVDGSMSRDHFGIIPGDCLAGVAICNKKRVLKVDPAYSPLNLEQAIKDAVRFLNTEAKNF